MKVYDRDNFNFNINCFPLDSNINVRNMLNVYNSQLIRHARICTNLNDFHIKHKYLSNKLIEIGFKVRSLIYQLRNLLKNFIFV